MRARSWMASLVVGAGIVALPVLASARGSSAPLAPQVVSQAAALDDTAAVARLLTHVRGANPLFCELTTRMVDGRSFWNSGGGGGLVEVDSASSAMIGWVHTDHRDARVVPRLAAALRDTDECVRRVAAGFLGRVEHAAATTALLDALDDPNADTRATAAVGLGLAEHPGALQPLVRRLKDASSDVRRSAAWALGRLENKSAMEPLIDLLRDPDPRVRQAAAWAIGQVTS